MSLDTDPRFKHATELVRGSLLTTALVIAIWTRSIKKC